MCSAKRLRHLFHHRAGLRAQHQARPLRRGCDSGGEFAVWVRQALVGQRGQQDGMRQGAAQQLHACVTPLQRCQHTGQQRKVLPRAGIGAQRHFICRAA